MTKFEAMVLNRIKQLASIFACLYNKDNLVISTQLIKTKLSCNTPTHAAPLPVFFRNFPPLLVYLTKFFSRKRNFEQAFLWSITSLTWSNLVRKHKKMTFLAVSIPMRALPRRETRQYWWRHSTKLRVVVSDWLLLLNVRTNYEEPGEVRHQYGI